MRLSRIILDDLARWRELAAIVARAAKMVEPGAEVYVVGGAAENRLTILSDIDVVIALPEEPDHDRIIDLEAKIFEKAEELGLPLHAPVELHIVGPRSLQKFLEKSKVVRIDVEG
ncbi:MAG: nucleotidyltransferase domain-containing protein [Sulfolobales archaeon]